ncbi:hypothetical protein B0J13DRAFT_635115 [Dactylonectria estremocensis]|uniref:Uncharacterized protein n=1 Tax=Dactylonectria estremocensis TaxID=1079267 RepID=A0A9P9J717_9HYPO|nr:hypothetical protein B0J13DRAFT_635115 [Dactylonectria estremocensis]
MASMDTSRQIWGMAAFSSPSLSQKRSSSPWPRSLVKTLQICEIVEHRHHMLNPDRDQTTGLSGLPFHASTTWGRYSSRERVLDTLRAGDKKGKRKHPLDLRLNSYVSKVFFKHAKKKAIACCFPRIRLHCFTTNTFADTTSACT